MSESNSETLHSYNERLAEYIDNTDHTYGDDARKWIDEALSRLTPEAKILEVGSGSGKGADYIEQTGFTVQRSDAAQGFVDYLVDQGHDTLNQNVVTDEIPGVYDMVFASAVLLHLNPEELETAFRNMHSALSKGGILVFSLKRGEGSEWSDSKIGAPRFFQYWEVESLTPVLERTDFVIDWLPNDKNNPYYSKWLVAIAKPV